MTLLGQPSTMQIHFESFITKFSQQSQILLLKLHDKSYRITRVHYLNHYNTIIVSKTIMQTAASIFLKCSVKIGIMYCGQNYTNWHSSSCIKLLCTDQNEYHWRLNTFIGKQQFVNSVSVKIKK